jgi:hypothetical protein
VTRIASDAATRARRRRLVVTVDFELVRSNRIAQRFVMPLEEERAALARNRELFARIAGVAIRRHGPLQSHRDIDAAALVGTVERAEAIGRSARPSTRPQWSLDNPATALFSAAGSYPLTARSPIMVKGTVRKPRATSSWYARSSSSTFFAVNATPSRERNSFTFSQLCQALPVYTITIISVWRGGADIVQRTQSPFSI